MLSPIRIDNRINGFLGKPAGSGKRPAMIHLHERYGIVQHTTDLGQKFVDAGYVTIVPDLFSRFTGDREALARGDTRSELSDEEVLQDIDLVVGYLRTLPDVDGGKLAMGASAKPVANRYSFRHEEIIFLPPSSCTAQFTTTTGNPIRFARSPSTNYCSKYPVR